MNELVQSDTIDMSDDTTKFSVSWVLCRLSEYGLRIFVESWNHHSIPSKNILYKHLPFTETYS